MNSLPNRKRVLVLCLADPISSPRPRRMVDFLCGHGFVVHTVGPASTLESSLVERRLFLQDTRGSVVARLQGLVAAVVASFLFRFRIWTDLALKLNDLRFGLANIEQVLKFERYDLMVVEDLDLLPMALRCRGSAKVLFDAREYYPGEFEGDFVFDTFHAPIKRWCCEFLLIQCDHIITVSEGLKALYEKSFDLELSVFRSVPSYADAPVKATALNSFRMVYHGLANPDRQLENLISVVKLLDERFTLDLYLVGKNRNINKLKEYCRAVKNVSIREPVSFEMIIPTLNQYDIGFYYLEPNGINLEYSLPNKLFEFIQARLAVAIGPSPNMREVIDRYGCGFVSDEFSIQAMADQLSSISPAEIDRAKSNSDVAAKELCFEVESRKLQSLLRLEPQQND